MSCSTALMEAKRRGRPQLELYTTSLSQRVSERLRLEHELARAIDRQELGLELQPQLLAEQTGQIHAIGALVMQAAFATLAQWRTQTTVLPRLVIPRLAMNLSALQVQSRQYSVSTQILEAMQHYRLDPGWVEFEITETAVQDDPEAITKQFDVLAAAGCRLAIDDFGTGYSSLEVLHRLPLHTMKIDRCFVERLSHSKQDRAIISTIIAMARQLNLTTLAEGVETEAQWAILKQMGCELFQGYLFSRPLSAEAFLTYLGHRASGIGATSRCSNRGNALDLVLEKPAELVGFLSGFNTRKTVLVALLTALGLAANAMPVPLFFGVQVIFGSLPAVFALLLWRDWTGLAIGGVASLYTWKLWGHPWAVLIFIAELVCLTLALRRPPDQAKAYPGQVVLWDIGYWALLGSPLVFVFYRFFLRIDIANVMVVALKQSLNGCLNTAAALILYLLVQLLGHRQPELDSMHVARPSSCDEVTLRSLVFALVLAAIAIPTLLMTLLTSHQLELATQRGELETLRLAAAVVARTPVAELRQQGLDGDERFGQLGFYRRDADGSEFISNPAFYGRLQRDYINGGRDYVHPPELQIWIPRAQLPLLKKWVNGYWHIRQGFSVEGEPVAGAAPPIEVALWQPARPLVVRLQQDSSSMLTVFTIVFVLGAFLSDWVGRLFDHEFNKVLAPLQGSHLACSLSVHDEPLIPTLSLSRVGELRRMASQINQRILRVNLLTAQLAKLSITDQLTGCLNRRALDQELPMALERSRRNGSPLSLIVFDIDHFKRVNDRFGHPVGDQVLVRVAQCVQERLRSSDVIYRIGGEEFLVLLFGCSKRDACQLAEKLTSSVAALALDHEVGQPLLVTISAGITQFLPDQDAADSLIRRADQGLYAAKQAGRNCVQLV
jgi:diguanylate cyclase (GGDEF)-like protein